MGNIDRTKLKAVRLDLSLDMHRALKVEAAKRDMTMSMLARELVREYLAKVSDHRGNKD